MAATELTKADFQSDQETRWCPGCGDYAVLAAVQALLPRARDPARADRVRVRHRLRGPLRVLHGHVRDARHPRARAGAGDRAGRRARGPLDLGRDRRRRRVVDRRQPPDPRAAPQRAGQDPALQQPDLRADQGAGVADVGARQGDEVDAVRVDRRAVQPGVAGAGRRGDVRGAHDRHRQAPPDRRCCAPRPRTRARRWSRSTRTARCSTTARSTRCATRSRARSTGSRWSTAQPIRFGVEGENGVVRGADGVLRIAAVADVGEDALVVHDAHRDDPSLAFALSRLSSSPDGPTPIGIFRDVSRPVSGRDLTHELARRAGRRRTTPSWTRCCTPGTRGRSPSTAAATKWTRVPAGRAAGVGGGDGLRRSRRRSRPRCTTRSSVTTSATSARDTTGCSSAFAGFAARRLGWSVDAGAGRARHRRDGRRRGAAAGADRRRATA